MMSVLTCLCEVSTREDQFVDHMCTGSAKRPCRNPLPSLGPFSLLKNEQVGLIDFWCPSSTNILEYFWGYTLAQIKQSQTPQVSILEVS